MTKAQDRELRQAWTRYDRLTAYMCAKSGRPYDDAACLRAKDAYEAVRASVFMSMVTFDDRRTA